MPASCAGSRRIFNGGCPRLLRVSPVPMGLADETAGRIV